MKYKIIIPVSLGLLLVLCDSQAQSTFSFEYGIKYSYYESTGVHISDLRRVKNHDFYTNFYAFGYQVKLFSDFQFETGLSSELIKYEFGIRWNEVYTSPIYSNLYQSRINSWGVPFRINYKIRIGKSVSLDPFLGFKVVFNEFSNNLDGYGHGITEYWMGSDTFRIETEQKETLQEKIVIIPDFGARLNYNLYDQFNLFAKAEFQMGFVPMNQFDYTIEFTEGNLSEACKGSTINKGTSINISLGLSYTITKKKDQDLRYYF